MGLPSSALLKENPGEYSRRLLEVAETNGITIYTHEDLPEESKEKVADLIKSGSGWYDEELKGVVVADLGTHDQKKLRELTHEIIHAIDFLTRNLGDGISIEEAEYRAYIVSDISKEVLERGDERTANSIIQLFSDGRIAGSCFNYYFQKSEKNFHDFISGLTSGEEKIPWY